MISMAKAWASDAPVGWLRTDSRSRRHWLQGVKVQLYFRRQVDGVMWGDGDYHARKSRS